MRGEPPTGDPVVLTDQFGGPELALTRQAVALCNPATKTHAGVVFPARNPEAHLVCYGLDPVPPSIRTCT